MFFKSKTILSMNILLNHYINHSFLLLSHHFPTNLVRWAAHLDQLPFLLYIQQNLVLYVHKIILVAFVAKNKSVETVDGHGHQYKPGEHFTKVMQANFLA